MHKLVLRPIVLLVKQCSDAAIKLESFLSKRASLVETKDTDLAGDDDARKIDAVNVFAAETIGRYGLTDSQGGRKERRENLGNDKDLWRGKSGEECVEFDTVLNIMPRINVKDSDAYAIEPTSDITPAY